MPTSLIAIGIGVAMSVTYLFWYGITAAYVGATWIAIDWWRTKFAPLKKWTIFSLVLAIFAALTWIAFRPAPLRIAFFLPAPASYAPGTTVGGVKWKEGYIDLRLVIINDGGDPYGNIDAVVRTDFIIAEVGVLNSFAQCRASSEMPFLISGASITSLDAQGKPTLTIPLQGPWHSNQIDPLRQVNFWGEVGSRHCPRKDAPFAAMGVC